MRELVTEGSYTCQGAVRLQFRCAGISVNGHAIQRQRPLCIIGKVVHMRPDEIVVVCIIFSMTGIEHKHFFRYTIIIPIVCGEVHITVNGKTSLTNHLQRMLVIAFIIVTSIIAIALGESHWSDNIEVEQKLTTTLRLEKVTDTSLEAMMVIPREIGNAVIKRLSGTIFFSVKLCIGEVDQDNQSTLLSFERCLRTR